MMTINFLLQALRILHSNIYTDDEVRMIYDFLKSVDDEDMNEYYNTCSIISYGCDLELYVEVINMVVKIYEQNEEYEKCTILQAKKQKTLDIICYYDQN